MKLLVTRRDDQNFWNFLTTLIYVLVTAFLMYVVSINRGLPTSIPPFDLVLITLAVYRLTRLFVYDKVLRFFRDLFIKKDESISSSGEVLVVRTKHRSGPLRSISDLLGCPWCIAVWITPFVLSAYFMTPYAWFPILILAVAGVAVFLEFLAHIAGWTSEYLKKLVEKK